MSVKKTGPFKYRLIEYLSFLGEGQTAFEKRNQLSRGSINNLTNSFKQDALEKIEQHNPELNMRWLIKGEGEMLKQKADTKEQEPSKEIDLWKELVATKNQVIESQKAVLDMHKEIDLNLKLNQNLIVAIGEKLNLMMKFLRIYLSEGEEESQIWLKKEMDKHLSETGE